MIGCKDEIAIDDDANRKPRPDGERRLDIEIAAHDLLPGLVEGITAAAPQRSNNIAIGIAGAELRADAEQCGEGSGHEQSAPVIVDLVFETLVNLKATGVTIILIEQFVHRALAFADRCMVLSRGSLAWEGPTDGALDEVLAQYLGEGSTTSVA